VAEGEVVAGYDAGSSDAPGEQLADEIFGAGRGKLPIEAEHQHRGRPGLGEQSLALVKGRQAERRQIGFEDLDRVRVEGRDHDRPPLVEAARDCPSRPPPGGRDGSRRNCRARRCSPGTDRGCRRRGSGAALAAAYRRQRRAAMFPTLSLDLRNAPSYLRFHPDPPAFRRRIRARVGFSLLDRAF
jgi:hypothetical protein